MVLSIEESSEIIKIEAFVELHLQFLQLKVYNEQNMTLIWHVDSKTKL